jgi:O-acetylhomoserine/O-acetylserine sulfhydrylase-like pyridoxal-dependent enzyme
VSSRNLVPCVSFLTLSHVRHHTHTKYLPHPASHVAIRGAREEQYTIVDITNIDKPNGRSKVLEEIELSRALFEVGDSNSLVAHPC